MTMMNLDLHQELAQEDHQEDHQGVARGMVEVEEVETILQTTKMRMEAVAVKY